MLQQKGVTQYGREFLQKELKNIGMQKVIVRSDGEPAIVALKRAAGNAFILDTGRELLEEVVRRGESQGNGLAEGAVKEVKAKVRTIRFNFEESLGKPVPDDHVVLAWLVLWAVASVNLGRKGVDGKTAPTSSE